MTQHTKGPWRYEAGTRTIRAVPSNHWIASMDSWDGAVNNEANARLIAAAPELLEALENLVDRSLIKDIDNDHYYEVLELINKAKGG